MILINPKINLCSQKVARLKYHVQYFVLFKSPLFTGFSEYYVQNEHAICQMTYKYVHYRYSLSQMTYLCSL